MKLVDKFPDNYTPRPAQIEILNKIQTAIEDDYKFIIIQAPTGCGKSHIAATLVNRTSGAKQEYIDLIRKNKFFNKDNKDYIHEEFVSTNRNGAFILTTTKYLQNQYEAIFQESQTLKGKQNYKCNIDETFSVNIAPCVLSPKLGEDCKAKSFCTYYNKLNDSLCSKFRTTNYSKYLTLPSIAMHCDTLICDEASELEDAIVNYNSITLNYKRLTHLDVLNVKPLLSDSPTVAKKWLSSISESAELSYTRISEGIKNNIHSKSYIQGEAGRLSNLKNIIDQIQIILSNWAFCKYIVIRNSEGVTITPLYIDKLTENMFSKANTVILLSSTIYDVECFAQTLGIKKYKYIEHPGVFDKQKSPIYVPGKINLNHNNIQTALPILAKQIQEICDLYPNVKGLIHTHTNAITLELQKRLSKDKRFLFRTNHLTNEHILFDHRSSEDATVIVSPSLAFGVDLPDDLCRFQIIVKLPYPNLGDKRINTLTKEDSKWYQSKMFTKLIQMSGRGTRNEFDYCDTFILDANFIRVTSDNWNKIPTFFKERLK